MTNPALGQIILFVFTSVQLAAQSPLHRRQAEPHESITENSCPPTQIDLCLHSSGQSCTSFNEALEMIKPQSDVLINTTFHIFGMFDLLYSGLLNVENVTSAMPIYISTTEKVRLSKERCKVLLGQVNLSTRDTKMCQWSYTCKHNFPSFLIEAKLDAQSERVDCIPLRVENFKLVKTNCLNDPGEPHWCRCEGSKNIIGYMYNQQPLPLKSQCFPNCHVQSASTLIT